VRSPLLSIDRGQRSILVIEQAWGLDAQRPARAAQLLLAHHWQPVGLAHRWIPTGSTPTPCRRQDLHADAALREQGQRAATAERLVIRVGKDGNHSTAFVPF